MTHILIAPRPRHEAGYGRLDGDALTSRPSPSAKTNPTLLAAGSEIRHPKPTLLPKHNQENLNHSKLNSHTLKPAIPPVGSFSPPRARSLLVFRSNNVKPASKLLYGPGSTRDQVYSPGSDGVKDRSISSAFPVSPSISSSTAGDVHSIDQDTNGAFGDSDEETESDTASHEAFLGSFDGGLAARRLEEDVEWGISTAGTGTRSLKCQVHLKWYLRKNKSGGGTKIAMTMSMCGKSFTSRSFEIKLRSSKWQQKQQTSEFPAIPETVDEWSTWPGSLN
ncbi:hypothetical protein LTR70_001232 [Exophiala xenobiotica]|uniref:Uncharacterized protein n=1 Tax=Lithohypha guttulata TaxID=1690604 RepID=A0ABR0KKG6_9EURO|nr:hypothetical protein LTR24_001483 [Lithohypha guttulata]KAK5328207.1 hypothetical protein LTR70_001232 [Exophiala xenobiotica]